MIASYKHTAPAILAKALPVPAKVFLLLSFVFFSNTTFADEALCQPRPVISPDSAFSADGKTHLAADQVIVNEKNTSTFTGNVIIQQSNKRIESDQAEYEKQNEKINVKGNVRFTAEEIQINSESANFDLQSEQATLQKSAFQSLSSRARGSAEQIEIKNKSLIELNDATYTTCDPGNNGWLLSASNMTLNNENRQGAARHVVIRFKDVPFFYFPYLRFPLGEERLSGFLFPSFGHSNEHGNELKIPYYWNIHPQLDATLTPWYMSKRGTMLDAEFRYLSEKNNGILEVAYLDKDKLVNSSRERIHWTHDSVQKPGWQFSADYNYVADNKHLTDFSDDLTSTSTTHLIRTGNLAYYQQNWLFSIKAEDYQVLSGSTPYKRLPQISLNSQYPEKNHALNYTIQSEVVRFDHTDNVVIGDRLHIKPSFTYPMRSTSGFIVPKLSLQYTSYNLKQTSGEQKLTRTIPTLSLDSGLFFERDSQFFQQNYIQTLEPQLFYVYVPYQKQSALPLFDTSSYAFNLNQSFADYRFNGVDRIGDDNRLTAALATRFLKQNNGQEIFMARLGQVYYFSDRKVQITPAVTDDASRSNLIAELKTQPGKMSLSTQIEWNPQQKHNELSSTQLGYHGQKFNIDFAHRFQRNTLETREMNMNWELSSRWKIHASHLYDLKANHTVENLFGINYESCCWGLRLSTKERYLNSNETDRGVYLELVLKGLGGFGIQQ